MIHAFSVDVEDWYQGIPVDDTFKAGAESRLERGLDRLLALMAEHGIRGTFFILGPLAQSHPHALKRIADEARLSGGFGVGIVSRDLHDCFHRRGIAPHRQKCSDTFL